MSDRPTNYRIDTASTRRARPHRRRLPRPVKIVLRLLVFCVILGVLYLALEKLSRPYLISRGESRQIASIERQISGLEAENKALKQEVAYTKTSRGAEVEARRLGWVKEGETAVVVESSEELPKGEIPAGEGVGLPWWKAAVREVAGLFVRGD